MNQEPWHILLIDDNAEDRADLRRMLLQGAQRRYRFSEAARGAEGLRMALEPCNGRIDCVLLDYHLPDMDAPEVLAALRNGAELPPCPVVVITAADNEEGPALLRAGAQDYIGRRWTSAEGLTRAVANSIERFGLLAARERADAALRDSEEHYRALFNSIDEGFCIIEMKFNELGQANDYRFLQVNPSFERQSGLVSATGRLISELVPQLEAVWFEAYGAVAMTGEPVRIESHAESMGRWFDVYAFRLGAPHLRQVAILFSDSSERKGIEAALHAATAAADKANRAKSDFLSRMSHELRSPLNAILGFAQLIESGTPAPNAAQKDSVDQILQAGWYLLALINEILDLALIETGKLQLSAQAISLGELMADCQAMVQAQAQGRGVRVNFPRFERPCFVQADRTRAKQVLINLLSNAIKYNRIGGQVDVRCTVLPGQRVCVSVEDTGPGLSALQLAQLFQPFNRLGQKDGAVQGNGIGLVVSKQLVELMGGRMGVGSTPGLGSRFWFELDADAMPQNIQAGLAAGFVRYLTQPIRVEEFMHTLDLALELATTHTARAAAEETP